MRNSQNEKSEDSITMNESVVLETFESIVMALILALVFRAFVIEPFVIPTGSMAPTLLGQHASIRCPQCGYHAPIGPRDTYHNNGTELAHRWQGVWQSKIKDKYSGETRIIRSDKPLVIPCPMCDFTIRHTTLPTTAGDRILVLKYNQAIAPPQRWDIVVFKNPNEPEVSFIKRLVGLPGEQLWIADGNIYTRPLDEEGRVDRAAPWRIQRKTERPKTQRDVWQPIYHSDYDPLDEGYVGKDSGRDTPWRLPWKSSNNGVGSWTVKRGLRWQWDHERSARAHGTLQFDFTNPKYRYNYTPYNFHEKRNEGYDDDRKNPVGEMRLAATVTPQGPRLRIVFDLTGRFLNVRGTIEQNGTVTIDTADREAGTGFWIVRASAQIEPLPVHKPAQIEFWSVDQSVSLWIDGQCVAGPWEYELEKIGKTLHDAREPGFFKPQAAIELSGDSATVRSIQLDRDLYYTQATSRDPGRATFDGPTLIPDDHFFCLGDNSPSSEDGRRWDRIDPWVAGTNDSAPGFVPRKLMMGRAFFVYYPASHRTSHFPLGVPNFGTMRFIH